jgi:hypothetical protein
MEFRVPVKLVRLIKMLAGYVITNCGYRGSKQLETVYYCMPPDDGRMTKKCCGNNIGRRRRIVALTDP